MKTRTRADLQKKYFIALFFVLFLLVIIIPSISDAGYKIFLKNGSTISGVSHYEKSGGEIKFYLKGGEIGIPESQILKIETSDEPVKDESSVEIVRPPEPKTPEEDKQAKPTEAQQPVEEKNQNADEIERKKAELQKINEDLNMTMIRIQATYARIPQIEKQIMGLLSKKSLTEQEKLLLAQLRAQLAQEKSILQQNAILKRKLESDKKRVEDEIAALQR